MKRSRKKKETTKIALIKPDQDGDDDNDKEGKLFSLKEKKEKAFKDMLQPDLIKACKGKGLPFIGTRAHLILALVREAAAENAVSLPGGRNSLRTKYQKEIEAR